MAKDCFTSHYNTLTKAIAGASPLAIATALKQKDLVGQHVVDGVQNARGEGNFEQAMRIMFDVEALINVNASAIFTFLDVLYNSGAPVCETVVAEMRQHRKTQAS